MNNVAYMNDKTKINLRNPNWNYTELVLAIELYRSSKTKPPGKTSIQVKTLSSLLRLNALSQKKIISNTYRNRSGVSLELQNLRRLDPEYKGKGLKPAGALAKEIWNRFDSLKKISKEADIVRDDIEKRFNILR